MPKPTGPTSEMTKEVIKKIRKVYPEIAVRLSKSRRGRLEVNLSELNNIEKENVIVAGKVLGKGSLDSKKNIYALEFSSSAENKIKESGGKYSNLNNIPEKIDAKVIV